ncbi:tetratricopeptide repeat protein [Allopontixanthobacter sp.]|uniref:tetratricopeptide repeat protein n=1 Tax=Allopontixanthobacter sp. TaxID=2906452 RepID=UPI002ABB3F19|nr:tetratricopeptide repeat protein [Allopontixanthobacter sp.]MDZ4307745.1 tetratricopeptide repeat protein [Allopontixanthobacter sp.]
MTCRPEARTVLRTIGGGLGAILLLLAACSEPLPEAAPIERAQQALAAQDGLGAEIILREMLAGGTPEMEIAAYLGEAELQQGQIAEARRWLESSSFTPATAGRGFHMLGRARMREGNLPEAGMAFDRALEFIPESPDLWVDIGRLRYLGGEHRQAVDASIRAAELGPQNVAALQFRAQLVRDAAGPEAALPWYEAALESNRDNLALMGDYAATLGELGQLKDMLVVVRRMIELDEENSQAFYLQAVLAARGGRFDLARNLLDRSGSLQRETPAAMLLSGIIDLETGNHASASQMFDRLERMQPDNARIRLLAARSLALGGKHRELVHRFEDRAGQPGAPPYLTTLVGRSYEVLGERAKAALYLDLAARSTATGLRPLPSATSLDVALARGPKTGPDAAALVRALLGAGQPAAAIDNAEAFLRLAPGSGDAAALAGDAYIFAGQGRKAAEYYANAAEIRQFWPLARRMVAAELAAGRRQSALTLLEYQLAKNSANTEAAVMLARAELQSGNAAKAGLLLDLAIANGAARDPQVWMLRAETALALDDAETAREAAIRAYSLQRMNPEATGLLARILTQTGGSDAQAQALAHKAARLQRR